MSCLIKLKNLHNFTLSPSKVRNPFYFFDETNHFLHFIEKREYQNYKFDREV